MAKTPAKTTPDSARGWLEHILDPGWEPLFDDVVGGDPLSFPGYIQQLRRARDQTESSESVVVADGAIGSIPIVAISFEFGFLGGSMGVATGERICRAFDRAAADKVPVVALTASGGARMQEGMRALAQMPATLAARRALARARQPFICYLRNPTTGGVYASFASSADLLWAEPGATIGFAGPRVAETVTGAALPEGSHTAEGAFDAALVDELVEPADLRARLTDALALLDGREVGVPSATVSPEVDLERDPWELVSLARRPDRPTGTTYIEPALVLRRGGDNDAIRGGFMKVGAHTVVVIAQDARAGTGRPTPQSYRRARHLIATAERLGLPIVTLVDTPGAEPGAEAERDGIAREISMTFEALLGATVPTVSCVVGEGGSGGALALAACDRLLIQRDAIFSVIAPEGAASILRRENLPDVARDLKLTATDLLEVGIADRIVTEPASGAHSDHAAARAMLGAALALAVDEAVVEGVPSKRRTARFRADLAP